MQPELPQHSMLSILWRRRWSVLVVTAASLAVGIAYLDRATPLYSSSSRIYVERTGPKIITDFEGVMTQSWNYLYTQAELLRSAPILAMAVAGPDIDVRKMKTFRNISNPVGYLKGALESSVGEKDEIITVSFL